MRSGSREGIPEVAYGTVVGNDFMIVRPLNRGSMGALYVAEQLSTASLRALKILRRDYVSDATLYKRFEREAQVAAKIPSEHVAQTISAGVDRKLDVPWICLLYTSSTCWPEPDGRRRRSEWRMSLRS